MANFFDPPPEEPELFNAEALDDTDECVLCRDRDDVSALLDAGVVGAVTVTGGMTGANVLKVLSANTDRLNRLRKITLALPDGLLREEIARRVGRHRCFTIDQPICEMDAGAVLTALANAEPFPIEGIVHVRDGMLVDHSRRPAPSTMTTGTFTTDKVVRLPTEGRLIVITGYPSSGKTAWARFLMVHTATNHRRRWCVFSPESQPWEEFAVQVAEVYTGKPFWPVNGLPKMSETDIKAAERWLGDKVLMLVCDAEAQSPTLDWLLTRLTACVLRDGITDFLIDPWNEVAQERGDMTETDFIGASLQRLKAFGLRHGVNIWIVAHPAKPTMNKEGVKKPPGPYDISSSAQWFNKADVGLTVHVPERGLTEIWAWKTRFRRFGERNSRGVITHNTVTGRYTDTDDAKAKQRGFFEGNQ
jgi:twinkle protein